MYAVCVRFDIAAGQMPAFLPLIRANAAASARDEAGCHRFDVLTDAGRPNEVFLYELYADRAAFDLHMTMAHFHVFDRASAALITAKQVDTWDEVFP
jgi:quinol monooxygenase YgiN